MTSPPKFITFLTPMGGGIDLYLTGIFIPNYRILTVFLLIFSNPLLCPGLPHHGIYIDICIAVKSAWAKQGNKKVQTSKFVWKHGCHQPSCSIRLFISGKTS